VTGQLWWVQIELNALNSPAVGWVTTAWRSARILPPPTGMSAVLTVAAAPALVAPPPAGALEGEPPPAGALEGEPPPAP